MKQGTGGDEAVRLGLSVHPDPLAAGLGTLTSPAQSFVHVRCIFRVTKGRDVSACDAATQDEQKATATTNLPCTGGA